MRRDGCGGLRPALARVGLAAVLLSGAGATGVAVAAGESAAHGAHEHGRGVMNVALEGEELTIELEIPAIHVVGSESAPRSEAARQSVARRLAPFAQAASLFELPAAARCEVEAVAGSLFDIPLATAGAHDHGKTHDHSQGSDRGDAHDHADFVASYGFHCHDPKALDRLTVHVFDRADHLESLTVQLVTDADQRQLTLRPDDPVVRLGR